LQGQVRWDENQFVEVVERLQIMVFSDEELRQYSHKYALHVAYGNYPESIRENQWKDEQELREESKQLQLYWSIKTNLVTKVLNRVAESAFFPSK